MRRPILKRDRELTSRALFIICIFFLCTACTYREPGYCKIIDRITINYLGECTQPRRLVLSGYGGAMANDIQSVSLDFVSFDALSMDEARALYVNIAEEFLQRINCHEEIRPHLHDFPFEIDNIELTIGFENAERKIIEDGHVALMFIGRNQDLFYRGYNPETEEFYSLHREPYREAVRLVKECSASNSN